MNRHTYAYGVCLISLVAVFLTLPRVISAALDYNNPLQVKQCASEMDVSSWDNFRREMEMKMGWQNYEIWLDEHGARDGGWKVFEEARNAG